MARQYWKPSNLLNPVPCVMISCRDTDGRENIMTAAWAGTICSEPVMVSVSIKKSRYSHDMILHSGEFVMNLTSRELVKAADYVGIKSGRNIDKFDLFGDLHLTRMDSHTVKAPSIAESPLCLECKVKDGKQQPFDIFHFLSSFSHSSGMPFLSLSTKSTPNMANVPAMEGAKYSLTNEFTAE